MDFQMCRVQKQESVTRIFFLAKKRNYIHYNYKSSIPTDNLSCIGHEQRINL